MRGPPARAVHDYGFPVCYDAEQPMGMAFAIEYLPTTIVVDRLLGKLIALPNAHSLRGMRGSATVLAHKAWDAWQCHGSRA